VPTNSQKDMLRCLPIVLVCSLSALAAFALGVADIVPPTAEIAVVALLALFCAGLITHLIAAAVEQRGAPASRESR
jgi:hypothetical protein